MSTKNTLPPVDYLDTYPTKDLSRKRGEVIGKARYGAPVALTYRREPVAVLLSVESYEDILKDAEGSP